MKKIYRARTPAMLFVLTIIFCFMAMRGFAATIPSGFQLETIVSGLDKPTTFAFAPDGRVFIAEKDGNVRLVKNGVLQATPVVTLSNINTMGDRGILGLALDPQFSQNGYVYIAYTHENSPNDPYGPKTGRIVRLTVQGDTASLSSMIILAGTVAGDASKPSCDYFPITSDCIPSDSLSHSVGGLRFGPDGKLYAALGDGAGFESVDSRANNSLNLDSMAGKIIRINTDGSAPGDNPYYNGDPHANRSKIFLYGVRNSYRFNFEPGSGALFFGDVGWKTYEEIDVGIKGGNYGWPCREGYLPQPEYNCTTSNYIDPIYVFDHSAGTAAVTGGAFPTTTTYPEPYRSSYFFGDVTGNKMKRMVLDANNNATFVEDFFDNAEGPVDIQTGPDGSIYFLSIYTGTFKHMTYSANGNNPPTARIAGTPDNGPPPLAVQFSSNGSSDPDNDPLSYVWDFGDGSPVSALPNPSHTYQGSGTYTASLTVNDGKGGTNTTQMAIRVGNFTTSPVDPHHVSTVTSPIPHVIGRDVNISSTISNSGSSSPFIVDMEVYNQSNVKVAQKVFENETIPTNGTKTYDQVWFPDNIGTYRVAVGLFHAGWTGLYEWTNEANIFTVENRAPTSTPFAPTHVSTAVSNPTPSVNQPTDITTNIKNGGNTAGSLLVDIEVYKNGIKSAQEFFDNQPLSANESKSFISHFTPAEAGTYNVSVGLFKPGWSGLYEWDSNVSTMMVSSSSGTAFPIYTDGLAPGVENWSWDTDASLGQELGVQFRSPWAGLYLHVSPRTVPQSSALLFSVNGNDTGHQKLQILFYGGGGQIVNTVPLSQFLSDIPPNTWKDVSIPLSILNPGNSQFSGIAFQGSDGNVQPSFRVDAIEIR